MENNGSKTKYQRFTDEETKQVLPILLPRWLRKKVRTMAFKEGKSMSLLCREIIEQSINN
tara:strand:- start:176 stop:355 length:180 start_codon:yes stop_codon:yes gene_type:complete